MSITPIRFTLVVNGSLMDATSVIFSDQAGLLGVQRTDSGATIVSAGTALTRIGLGTYEYDLTDPAPGLLYNYFIQWVFQGSKFWVEQTIPGSLATPLYYCTVDQVKNYPPVHITDTVDDTAIIDAINSVKNNIDNICRWSFNNETRVAEERSGNDVKVDNNGDLNIRVDKCPVTNVASVEYRFRPSQAWTAIPASQIEYYPTPSNTPRALADSNLIKCYSSFLSARGERTRVRLTYSGGFATVPPSLGRLATRMSYWRYKQGGTSFEKTAIIGSGQVIIPSNIPGDVMSELNRDWKRYA